MARPSTGHVRSHNPATPCRASRPARTPRRRSRKMAQSGGFGVYFEHLYTSVNGVANRGARALDPGERAGRRNDRRKCVILFYKSQEPCFLSKFFCSRFSFWLRPTGCARTSSDCSSVPGGEICRLSSFRLQPFAFSFWTALLLAQGTHISSFRLQLFAFSFSTALLFAQVTHIPAT